MKKIAKKNKWNNKRERRSSCNDGWRTFCDVSPFDRILRTRLNRASRQTQPLYQRTTYMSANLVPPWRFHFLQYWLNVDCYVTWSSSPPAGGIQLEQQTCRPYRLRRIQTVQHLKNGLIYYVTGGFTHDYSLICGTSYTAQMSAGRWWTNKGVHVSWKFLHSGFVAHQWSLKEENE